MSHHSSRPWPDNKDKTAPTGEAVQRLKEQLGATGQFPEGKLNEDDEGELAMRVGVVGGKVVLDFGKKIAWIGLTKEQARTLGTHLIRHSNGIED